MAIGHQARHVQQARTSMEEIELTDISPSRGKNSPSSEAWLASGWGAMHNMRRSRLILGRCVASVRMFRAWIHASRLPFKTTTP